MVIWATCTMAGTQCVLKTLGSMLQGHLIMKRLWKVTGVWTLLTSPPCKQLGSLLHLWTRWEEFRKSRTSKGMFATWKRLADKRKTKLGAQRCGVTTQATSGTRPAHYLSVCFQMYDVAFPPLVCLFILSHNFTPVSADIPSTTINNQSVTACSPKVEIFL